MVEMNRRNFFRASAGVAVSAVLGNEIVASEQGIKTSTGIFIPLYENHISKIAPNSFPPKLDFVFREGTMNKGAFETLPENLLYGSFKDGVLDKLAQNNTKVVLGDTIPRDLGYISYGIMIGETVLAASVLSKVAKSRRGFLKGVINATRLWLASSALVAPGLVSTLLPDQFAPLHKIATRPGGLATHLHPENPLLFFRNALMVDKMLMVSEVMAKEQGRSIRAAYNVGSGHSGMEDFLQAGREVCRTVITAQTKGFLQRFSDYVGGAQTLCTARMFEFPEDFEEPRLFDPARSGQIKERKIYDQKLLAQLQQMGVK